MHRLKPFLMRLRENYYLSALLASAAKPVHSASRLLALQVQRKIRKNGVTIPLPNGKKMTIGKDTGIAMSSLLFWHGLDGHEPDTSRTLRFLFERAATFVDVGANCGIYSILAPLWNPNLQVVAFEPVPAIFERLQRNVKLNHLETSVRCENSALSSQTGRAILFLPAAEALDLESTGTLVTESWQARRGAPQLDVETVRFDDYEALHPMHVDLVKIDVEDFEASVLDGMRSTIMRDRPFIVCEVLPRPHRNQRTTDIVNALHYQPYWITPMGYIRVPHFDFRRGNATDFLLSPVSTPDAVLDDLSILWELNQESSAGNAKKVVERPSV
jgi:FkbM family methyltransferase